MDQNFLGASQRLWVEGNSTRSIARPPCFDPSLAADWVVLIQSLTLTSVNFLACHLKKLVKMNSKIYCSLYYLSN